GNSDESGVSDPSYRGCPPVLRPPSSALRSLAIVLCFAFSYGFWRYANEAETYILAGVFVLAAWCLVLRGRVWWSVVVSALGVLVHLLNAVPLLLIIPLYYLLSRDWKKAVLHGALTGVLVVAGYLLCSPWLDFSTLGAQHHAIEGGIGLKNAVRGGMAFGQNLLGANFLFGFESFRAWIGELFPTRMLDEEFFMGATMPAWVPWAGVVTLAGVLGSGVWALLGMGVRAWRSKGVSGCGSKGVRAWLSKMGRHSIHQQADGHKEEQRHPLFVCSVVWFVLYALAVIRTEAGSPELWIMALIPFWLAVAVLLQSVSDVQGRLGVWVPVTMLMLHNLVAGLLPVRAAESDYHRAKSAWVLEHAGASDRVLVDYEPVLIFYLNYCSDAAIINSGEYDSEELQRRLRDAAGETYAFHSFFEPMGAMRHRSPAQYEKMARTGLFFKPFFEKVETDAFGGIYRLRRSEGVRE
ncbi:hypothetical protein, partial [Pontiella sp.]|uniref:hypothetical protein n=1 Tax=Pontiella sp. TaxID=2837462 RepID=UPI0035639CAD